MHIKTKFKVNLNGRMSDLVTITGILTAQYIILKQDPSRVLCVNTLKWFDIF